MAGRSATRIAGRLDRLRPWPSIAAMDFRLRALLQWALAPLPLPVALDVWSKRRRGSLPVGDAQLRSRVAEYEWHAAAIRRHAPGARTVIEFGAGYDLLSPLLLAARGFAVTAVDRRRLADRALVRDAAMRLDRLDGRAADPLPTTRSGYLDALHGRGVTYLAPCGIAALPAGGADAVVSTAVLEHVPRRAVPALAASCQAALRPGGVLTAIIDYQDHWHYLDPKVGPLHFLRWSDPVWALLNPPRNHQNRMRHGEYLRAFAEAGFELVEATTVALQLDPRAPLAARFHGMPREELALASARLCFVRRA